LRARPGDRRRRGTEPHREQCRLRVERSDHAREHRVEEGRSVEATQIRVLPSVVLRRGTTDASGERFNPNDLTAAHKTLPFNTMVRVTNTSNGQAVDVRINDRGPFVAGRCIDLSRAAFDAIASESAGVAQVTVEVLK
jgi:hypothetical protein